MSSQLLLSYALNAAWQAPLIAAAAWLFLRVARLTPVGEHRLWLAVLVFCVLLPTRGLDSGTATTPETAPLAADRLPEPTHTLGARASAQPAFAASQFRLDAETGSTELDLLSSPAATETQPPVIPAPQRATDIGQRLPVSLTPLWRLRTAALPLTHRDIRAFAILYTAFVLFALLRLVRGHSVAHRLLSSSTEYALDKRQSALWRELGENLSVTLPPLRSSITITSPVVVGILHPALLLPEAFRECSAAQQRAALSHELAHIRRRDCLIHTLSQLLILPLVWHPIIHAVERRIARTREMICDSIAAREMRSDVAYARSLLSLAQAMLRSQTPDYAGPGLGLFRSNKLEERIMQLTAIKPTLTLREALLRRAAGAAILISAIAGASVYHLSPVLAQEAPAAIPAPPTAPKPPDASPATVQAPVAPVAPDFSPSATAAPPAMTPPSVPAALIAPPMPGIQTAAPPPSPTPAPTPFPDAIPAPIPAPAPPAPPALQATPGFVIDDNDLNVAHGQNAHLIVKDGQYVHRWIGQDGKPFELVNSQAGDLTPAQRRAAEAEYREMTAKAQKELEKVRKQFDSPEFKAQMDKLTSGAINADMAKMQKQIAAMKLQRFDTPEFKAQMDQLTSGAVNEEMAKLQQNIAEMKLQNFDTPEFKVQMDKLKNGLTIESISPEQQKKLDELMTLDANRWTAQTQRQIAEAERQAALANSPEFQQRIRNAERNLQDAQKRLQEAEKQMTEGQKKTLESARKSLDEAARALQQTLPSQPHP
jgi:beta-lactamase regulating signal transducer with metallopeptidase domain